ncbi:PAS domain-containing protein, partial [Thermodesulfobacteriota bacterium]
ESIQETLKTHKPFNIDYRFILKDGSTRIVRAMAELIPDSSGKFVILSGTGQDITERSMVDEEIRKSERRLRESQEVARIGSWSSDLTDNTLEWSDETFRRFDKDPETFTPTTEYFLSLIHPDDREGVRKAIEDSLTNDAPYHIQSRIRNESGREWILEGFGRIERDAEGNPLRFAGTAQDITDRKQVEKQILKREEYIRNILDTVDEGFVVVDQDYRISTVNKAYCSQVGMHSDEVLGNYCYEVSHGLDRPCYEMGEECAAQKVFATGDFYTTVHEHVNNENESLFVEIKAFPNKDDAGNVISVIEVIRNITEKHLLEAEQLKTQKLEAVGRLAGGIAHDFNNMLQGVFGSITMAKLHADDPAKVSELLAQAEKALSMSVNLTNQLLTFAKGGKPVLKITDLKSVIANTATFALSGSSCKTRLSIPQDLWHSEVDAGQLAQVIQNIVLNANEAMPDGGTIDISAENIEIANSENLHLPDGEKFVRIDIRDTGAGIPKKYISRIFDPYFTTKEKGSGLGLATTYSILKNHGGTIEVQSTPESGTTFSLYLPASASRKESSASVVPKISATRKFRILVMDDEEYVLEVAQGMLKIIGHDMEGVTQGESAVEKYRQALGSENNFDIVILDLTIKGGLGGMETIKRLLELDPNVKAIVASGYSDNPVISNFKDYGFSALLHKPYTLAELRDCLGKFTN